MKVGKTGAPAAPAEDQYVELAREKTDKIFVVLAEFGNERAPGYPDQDTDQNIAGPDDVRRPAAQPDPGAGPHARTTPRSGSRTTTSEHYQDLYFGNGDGVEIGSRPYYERQSSGRYSVDGQVTDWVKVPLQRGPLRPQQRLPVREQRLLQHLGPDPGRLDAWVADQKAEGRTDAQIKADLASYDQWDRNDFDHDGNFNEPDGYIDHFQIVHAGGDQADGDPYQGEDAIWSHRWKALPEHRRRPARRATRTAARRSATPACGSRLHDAARERRRVACSRTSTATTSACRTTTTPPAARQRASTGGR